MGAGSAGLLSCPVQELFCDLWAPCKGAAAGFCKTFLCGDTGRIWTGRYLPCVVWCVWTGLSGCASWVGRAVCRQAGEAESGYGEKAAGPVWAAAVLWVLYYFFGRQSREQPADSAENSPSPWDYGILW